MSEYPEEWVEEQPEGEDPLGEQGGLDAVAEELGLKDDEEVPREEDERLR